jgi:outer membrane protein OmpA-like peptidoglycan-associated protein
LGYGTFSGTGSKRDLDFDLAYIGTAEAGIKWRLNNVLSLYTGAYFEYGFNNAVKGGHGDRFLVYNASNPADFTTNSALTSQFTDNGRTESFIDRASPAAVGVKVRLGVNLCQKEKREKAPKAVKERPVRPTPAPTPTPEVEPTPEVIPPTPVPPRVKPPAPPRTRTEEFEHTLSDEEIIESLHRLVSEYGSSVKAAFSIRMSGEGIEQYLAGYDLNQSSLSPNMRKILDAKIAEIRAKHGTNVSIIVEGHTCNIGTEAANMRVGQRRADVVRQYLISKGFNAQKVTAVSKGQSAPIAPNTTEANRRNNRRVVLIVTD